MPSDPKVQPSIETLVADFSAAESALRTLVEESRKLATAQEALDRARSAVETAEHNMAAEVERNRQRLAESAQSTEQRLTNSLEKARNALTETAESTAESFDAGMQAATKTLASAESTLADSTSALYTLASELKENARELRNTAVAFRDLDPQALSREMTTQRNRLNLLLILAALGVALAGAAFGVTLL